MQYCINIPTNYGRRVLLHTKKSILNKSLPLVFLLSTNTFSGNPCQISSRNMRLTGVVPFKSLYFVLLYELDSKYVPHALSISKDSNFQGILMQMKTSKESSEAHGWCTQQFILNVFVIAANNASGLLLNSSTNIPMSRTNIPFSKTLISRLLAVFAQVDLVISGRKLITRWPWYSCTFRRKMQNCISRRVVGLRRRLADEFQSVLRDKFIC